MSPRTFAVVGTLLLAVVIGGSLLLREQANVAHPSPSPSVVPADLLPSLVGRWAGAPHTVTGIAQGSIVRASISESGLWQIGGATIPTGLNSDVAVTGPDRLTLTTIDTKTCQKGDVGTYRFSLSPGKKRLTLKESRLTRPAKEKSTDGTVAALSETAEDLSREIAEALGALEGKQSKKKSEQ